MLDSFSSLLFERAWRLLIILVIVQFSLICVWSWRRGSVSKRAVWIGFAAIPFLLSLSTLVVTPREEIIAVCHDMAQYVDDGNTGAVVARLSGDFQADGMDRRQFVERLFRFMERQHIDDAHLSGFDVTFATADQAAAEFDASGLVRGDGLLMDRVLTRWRLSFRREAGVWRVTRAELVPTPLSPLRSLLNLID